MKPVFTREQHKAIVRRVLENTFVGALVVNKKGNNAETWEIVAESLKEYLAAYGSRS